MRASRHDLCLLTHHDREMRRQHFDSPLASTSAQSHAHHGHGLQQLVGRPAGVFGDFGAADLHQKLNAAPRRIDQSHQGHAQLVRHALDVNPLVGDRGFRRARPDREIVGMHRHFAALHAAKPHDGVGGIHAFKGPFAAVMAFARQRPQFPKTARIHQVIDALACIQATTGLEAGQRLSAAHGACLRTTQLQLGEFGFPLARRLKNRPLAHAAPKPKAVTKARVSDNSASR